ncbi:DUF7347 domain-containing protein [Haloarchaeobius sp. DT45]|uniref:DUF7347 domain-containing protein n=1 Tax=Haloarchaeobius sp. DT45 TaxID=3446116 RepID=UPI003F6B76AF
MSEDRSVTDIIRLLADEIRVGILRAVAVAQYELEQVGSGAAELAFSEIYDHVDVENTPKLSFLLGELLHRKRRKLSADLHSGSVLLRQTGESPVGRRRPQLLPFRLYRGYRHHRERAQNCDNRRTPSLPMQYHYSQQAQPRLSPRVPRAPVVWSASTHRH